MERLCYYQEDITYISLSIRRSTKTLLRISLPLSLEAPQKTRSNSTTKTKFFYKLHHHISVETWDSKAIIPAGEQSEVLGGLKNEGIQ
ncbi:hypothetical protein C5167_046536 [Papaver somniferum]|uniref:Uncharacterized protein n=1 Tax=Papaver somniferum TaxID=3469 RepID=A0A4Y7LHR7_PAPSO|nr:hypothetical protein C5167_046536 [Papaver somniferum]